MCWTFAGERLVLVMPRALSLDVLRISRIQSDPINTFPKKVLFLCDYLCNKPVT